MSGQEKKVPDKGQITSSDAEGPFREAASLLLSSGLVPIPCGGEVGKRPLISGFNKLSPAGVVNRLPELVARFGQSNVAIACGPSGIVVVDIDDPALLEAMLEQFGPTPLIVKTPSGGFHLYYSDVER